MIVGYILHVTQVGCRLYSLVRMDVIYIAYCHKDLLLSDDVARHNETDLNMF